MTHSQKNGLVEFVLLPLISLVWLLAAIGCLLIAVAKRLARHGRHDDNTRLEPAGPVLTMQIQTPRPNVAKIRRRKRRAHAGIAARRA
jgi:hypothetical protein